MRLYTSTYEAAVLLKAVKLQADRTSSADEHDVLEGLAERIDLCLTLQGNIQNSAEREKKLARKYC